MNLLLAVQELGFEQEDGEHAGSEGLLTETPATARLFFAVELLLVNTYLTHVLNLIHKEHFEEERERELVRDEAGVAVGRSRCGGRHDGCLSFCYGQKTLKSIQ